MASKQDLLKIANHIKSRAQSALEALSSMAATLRQDWAESMKHINVITEISTLGSAVSEEDTVKISDDSLNTINQLISGNDEIVFNINANEAMSVKFDQTNINDVDVYINDEKMAFLRTDDQQMKCVNFSHPELFNTLEHAVYNQSENAGLKYALADISATASQADWTNVTNLSSSLYAMVDSYSNTFGEYVNDLISAIAKGPIALVQLITSIINKVKEELDSSNLAGLLNSTSIVLNKFGWGIVAQTIGSVITAIGTVAMAFSRVVGVIMTIAGAILSIFGRVVVSATTAFDSTQYKVSAGNDVCHAFKFVLYQGEINNAGVASYMRRNGWEVMTVICPHQASVYLMYLQDYDSDDDTIVYEQHLSCDIDVSQVVTEMPVGGGADSIPIIPLDVGDSDNKSCCIGYYPAYDGTNNGVQFWQAPMYMVKRYGTGGNTSASFAYSLRRSLLDSDIYFPVDFTLFDVISQWYSGKLQDFLDVRLCSAIIIWLSYKFSNILGKGWSSMGGDDQTIMGIRYYFTPPWPVVGLYNFFELYRLAWMCFATTSGEGQSSYLKSDFGLSSTQRDDLIAKIQLIFDQLAYTNYIVTSGRAQQFVRGENSGGHLVFTELNPHGHDLTSSDLVALRSSDDMFISMFRLNESFLPWSSGVWSKVMAVELPTLTFTGFIAGLIIDGILLAATAAIATVAVVGWIKLRNYRSQLQAQAESAWYRYEDEGQTKELWKDYKRARFKYNILAMCTGASTLSLGLYDDDAANGNVISTLKGFMDSGEESESVSLKELVTLIKGNVAI